MRLGEQRRARGRVSIQQITIIGTGLIGGSFALALRQRGFRGRIIGCDRPHVLEQGRAAGAFDRGIVDPVKAVAGSQVALLATPVGAIIDLVERLGPVLPRETLLTDVGSTKREIVARARAVFGEQRRTRFLGGHPMAGREHGGIEHAVPNLFDDAVWFITPDPPPDGAVLWETSTTGEYLNLLKGLGARVIAVEAERHDRLCAWISHLPQMVSTALAAAVLEELGDDPDLLAMGGRALREMTRIAASPYSMWRDIALTNRENIQQALQRLEQRLAHIRENLATGELKREFEAGNRFHAPPPENPGG